MGVGGRNYVVYRISEFGIDIQVVRVLGLGLVRQTGTPALELTALLLGLRIADFGVVHEKWNIWKHVR